MLFPSTFSAPQHDTFAHFEFRALAPQDAQADYQAVMTSAARIRGIFGPTNGWPPTNLSYDENLQDIVRHQREFAEQRSFAYTVWSAASYVGCVYIKPFKSRLERDPRRKIFKELCYLWVSEQYASQDEDIFKITKAWVASAFPLTQPVWLGREYDWDQWNALALADSQKNQAANINA